ncbi:hypothetical protein K469DRAFT_568400 [Zopfia rhizophila CBS 207.26]|uniref:Zn(2)-C6 fungal-type domain-containing protein n=1 Tax=Zopfia rhizophila CBS 207.26 TaxID=1314779 RepID=A0A6A6E7L3_9PEZI|nr:hypothetical protein K469DRAFT_568400 [Zopfia rhizophila CBS 207.26]
MQSAVAFHHQHIGTGSPQPSRPSPQEQAGIGNGIEHDVSTPAAAKRKRGSSRMPYPRKRALRACDACRKRKIKCDNQRPTCGGCKDLEIDCDFGDSKPNRSTYDLASLEILERLDYAVGLLEAQSNLSKTSPAAVEDTNFSHSVVHHHPTPGSLPYSEESTKGDAEILLESLEIAGRNPQVSEDILDWPIFQGKYDRARTEGLIFNPRQGLDDTQSASSITSDPIRTSRPGRGIQEEDVPHLINKFLTNVHTKNPVLDADDLKRKGRSVVEHGFSWDAASCLLLVVCALASISSKFTPEPVTPNLVDGPSGLTSISDTQDYSTAESYYVAAQKRIGLLENSILTTQCYFLSGVYEMYSLRPLKAWASFNRACITLQIYLRGQPQRHFSGSKGVERRLYWSCLKSEWRVKCRNIYPFELSSSSEIRMEINLPPSGLAKVNYPDVFPTPPSGSPELPGASFKDTAAAAYRNAFSEPDMELIWCYYLSEIAVRKIGNRLMNCFYEHDESSWLSMPLNRMIRVAEELELQLSQWFEHLPTTLATTAVQETHDRLVTEELQFVLHARMFDFRERIYRPFLYLSIYHLATDPIQQTLAPYVHRCVEACLTCLLRGTPRHRHHGTWYENRGMYLKSLLLVAAVKSGKIHVPDLWRQGVQSCIAGFKFWEQEAPDLRESRFVLQKLLAELNHNSRI